MNKEIAVKLPSWHQLSFFSNYCKGKGQNNDTASIKSYNTIENEIPFPS